MRRHRLILRPQAEVDVEDAQLWYETQQAGLGFEFDDDLGRLLDRIRENALQFPEIASQVRRGLLHRFPYAVYFGIEADAVVVFAVLHQRRRPGTWKQRAES